MIYECLLKWVEHPSLCQPFDSNYLVAVGFDPESQTGIYGLPVEDDGAGAAVAVATTFLSTRQAKLVSQDFQKGLPWLH